MSWSYRCPKCKAMLNPDETIILIGEHPRGRTLIGLHPEPGNYQIYLPPGTPLNQGDTWSFFCPVCQKSIVTEENDNLCGIELVEGNQTRTVLFSRIAGEKATFVVAGERLENSHGEHVERYRGKLVTIRF